MNGASLFITCEGGEGAGKSTLLRNLAEHLKVQGYEVLSTREPGGVPLGEEIRKILLSPECKAPISLRAELMLFLAARAQHIEELIKPALAAGKIVLCDRFNDSTVAYQGYARGLGAETVQRLCSFVCNGIEPDLTLFLDVDPSEGLQRTQRTHKDTARQGCVDRIEAEKLEFHQRVRQGMRRLLAQYPERIRLIDANQPSDAVFDSAIKFIEPLLTREDIEE